MLVHTHWACVLRDTPTCGSCGAIAAAHGPVIPMKRGPRFTVTTSDQFTTYREEGES